MAIMELFFPNSLCHFASFFFVFFFFLLLFWLKDFLLIFSITITTDILAFLISCLHYLVQSSSIFSLAVLYFSSFSVFYVLVNPIWCHCWFLYISLLLNRSFSVNWSNIKLEKLERKSPLYGTPNVNTRRNYRCTAQH